MDQLWSPWRSEYVTGAHEASGCFLCEASNNPDSTNSNNLLVTSTEQVIVVLNRYPYNAGHLLVAPRLHEGGLDRLPAAVAAELMYVLQWSLAVVNEELRPHGVNVGANLGRSAGAGVPDHLHIHIVPRWTGDTNFMPVISDVKVVSEGMETMLSRLREAFLRHPKV